MPVPATNSSRIPIPGARKMPNNGARTSFLQPPTTSFLQQPQQRASNTTIGTTTSEIPRLARSYSTPQPFNVNNNHNLVKQFQHQQHAPTIIKEELTIQIPPPPPLVASRSPATTTSNYRSVLPSSPSTNDDSIRVLLRIRPIYADETQHSRRCLEVAPDRKGVTLAPFSLQEKRFGFDQVFSESCRQEDIFQDAGLSAVENTLNGYNGCIFAYGQTGSGKTYTMLGASNSHDIQELRMSPARGIIPRIFEYLFRRLGDLAVEKGEALKYSLSCSYLEIYNEKVFDLLEEGGGMHQPKAVREDTNKEVYVEQLCEMPITSEQEAIQWLQIGSSNRRMAATDMNRESSRSHAVFTIKLVQTERTSAGVQVTRRSQLHLVDLAGSEKQRQTSAAGQRLKEAAQINKSLSALGNVIMSLVDVSNGQKRHVHYRDSKLTFLLRDSLGGNAITTIVATISAEEKYFAETLSTLKFAQRAKFIKNNAVQNQDADSLVPALKQEIERLREEITALKSGGASLTGESSSSASNYHEQPQIVEKEPRKNRWEPALDVMERLLKASGAMGPADLEENEDCEHVEVRCDRLEMLLYRMICRFEEHKEMAFGGADRFRAPKLTPAPSLLRAPKKYGALIQQTDNQSEEKHIVSLQEEQNRAKERVQIEELEMENNLMRQELCDLLEWKAFVEEERKQGNFGMSSPPERVSESFIVPPEDPNEELVDLLNVYRSMFEETAELIDEKKPILCSPPSPASGSSVTEGTTVSYASGGEEDNDDREGNEVSGEDNDADNSQDGGDVSDNYREIRRVQTVSMKLERKMDQYQAVIQRLEKDLQAAQDELETSSAATKFAEFQLQQLRDLTSDEEAKLLELENTLSKVRKELQESNTVNIAIQKELDEKTQALTDLSAHLEVVNKEYKEQLELLHKEKTQLQATVASFEEHQQQRDEELKRLLEQQATTNPAQSELEERVIALQQMNFDLENLNKEYKEKLEVLQCQDKDMKTTVSSLEERLRVQDVEIKRLLDQNATDEHEMKELQANVHGLEERCAELDNSNQGCKEQLRLLLLEQEELDAVIASFIKRYQLQDEEMRHILTQSVTNNAATLVNEKEEAQRTLDHLQMTLNTDLSEEDRAGIQLALLSAQSRIRELEEEIRLNTEASQHHYTPTSQSDAQVGGISSSDDDSSGASSQLRNLFDVTLKDRTHLLATLREFDTKRQKHRGAIQMLSTTIRIVCIQIEKHKKAELNKQIIKDEVKKLEEENARLQTLLNEKPDPLEAMAKQNNEIKRLIGDRIALKSRLYVTQQQMLRLEEELSRARNDQAANQTVATEFFCGI